MTRSGAFAVLLVSAALSGSAAPASAESDHHCRTERPGGAPSRISRAARARDVELRLRYSVDSSHTLPRALWVVSLRNRTRETLTLTFPTSQYADVVVRRGSVIRYRWSLGRVFLQAFSSRTLRPSETYICTLGPDPLVVGPGPYTVIASLSTSRIRVVARRPLVVPRLMQ